MLQANPPGSCRADDSSSPKDNLDGGTKVSLTEKNNPHWIIKCEDTHTNSHCLACAKYVGILLARSWSGETLLYSGKENEDGYHGAGVALCKERPRVLWSGNQYLDTLSGPGSTPVS